MCWGDAGRKTDIQYRLLRELTSRQSKTWRAPSKYLYCSSGLQTCSLAMENWEKQGNSEWPWQTPVLSAESQWFNLLSSPQLRSGHDVVHEGSFWSWATAAAGCCPQHLGARPHRGSAPCSSYTPLTCFWDFTGSFSGRLWSHNLQGAAWPASF